MGSSQRRRRQRARGPNGTSGAGGGAPTVPTGQQVFTTEVAPEGQRVGAVIISKQVDSLLGSMEDGNEYGSIVSLVPKNMNVDGELREAISDIQRIRNRPCLVYAANIIKKVTDTGIDSSDHLPFSEMVDKVGDESRGIDIVLATPGGSAEQVNLFVEATRRRFKDVQFIVPYKAMSAGTLWALSGDEIVMDHRAFLGPLDPQIPAQNGVFAPAQALLALIAHIQKEGQQQIAQGGNPDWTHVQIIRHIDQLRLGQAIRGSEYIIKMAAQYLERWKFASWTVHGSNQKPVTNDERKARATQIATELCSYDRWKNHGHAISRDVLSAELRLRVLALESTPGLQRAVRRLWALLNYVFDKALISKAIFSENYAFFRFGKEITG